MSENPDPKRNPFNITSDAFREGLSDRGAKDLKEANLSTERTSKAGGFIAMSYFFDKLGLLTDNPVIAVLIDFFTLMGTVFNAGFSESAQILSKALFTEENIKLMQDLGEATGEVMTDGITPMVTGLQDLRDEMDITTTEMKKMTQAIKDAGVASTAMFGIFGLVITNLGNINKAFQNLVKWLDDVNQKVQDLLNIPLFGGGGGGGGGGGDDDDTWWWPFD